MNSTTTPSRPLVDIGMPVFRRTRYLAEAIESVMGQTYENWRLIISENGPGGGEIEKTVQPYLTDSRVSYFTSGEVVSIAANWNRLLDLCSAPYVTQLHDDDRWHPDWLENRVSFLEEHRECGLVFSPTVLIDELGETIVRLRGRLSEGVLSREQMTRQLLVHNVIPVPAWLVRSSTLDEVGRRFKDFLLCDWELWVRLAAHAPVGYLDVHDNEYRKHTLQTTYTFGLSADEMVRLYEEFDRVVADELPGARFEEASLRRGRSSLLLSMALDAFEGGPRRDALRFFRIAVRESPRLLLDTRSLGLLVTVPFGRTGSRVLRHLRWNIQRRAITPHLRPKLGWRGERPAPTRSD